MTNPVVKLLPFLAAQSSSRSLAVVGWLVSPLLNLCEKFTFIQGDRVPNWSPLKITTSQKIESQTGAPLKIASSKFLLQLVTFFLLELYFKGAPVKDSIFLEHAIFRGDFVGFCDFEGAPVGDFIFSPELVIPRGAPVKKVTL